MCQALPSGEGGRAPVRPGEVSSFHYFIAETVEKPLPSRLRRATFPFGEGFRFARSIPNS